MERKVSFTVYILTAIFLLGIIFMQYREIKALRSSVSDDSWVISTGFTKSKLNICLMDNEYATMILEDLRDTGYGSAELIVYVTNHMKDRLKFWFQDSYVNDESVMIRDGNEVAPGKSGRFECNIPLSLLSVEKAAEITTIETHISIDAVTYDSRGDVHYERIGDTPRFTINFKDNTLTVNK